MFYTFERGTTKVKIGGVVLCAAALMLPTVSHAGIVYYLNTGQTMSQPSIDSADTTDWYAPSLSAPVTPGTAYVSTSLMALDASFSWDLGGGNFDMKDGSGTVADITLSLWDGGLGGTEVASVTWTNTQFCANKAAQGDNCQQFNGSDPVPLYFTDNGLATGALQPYTLQAGHSYLVELTSNADTIGSVQYFIKAPGVVTINDPNGALLADPSVPEPASWTMLLTGGAMLFAGIRRRVFRS